jgi:flagellar biosynthesis protein FlhB
MDEPRTEAATPRKLARARRQGIVPKSPELAAAGVSLALLACLAGLGARWLRALAALVTAALGAASAPRPPGVAVLAEPLREVAWLATAPLLAIAAAAVLSNLVQVGPLFAVGGAAPDLRRLDPLPRMRALLSGQRWAGALFALLKASVVLAVAASVIVDARNALGTLALGSPARALHVLAVVCGQLVLYVAIALVLLGAADLIYRRVQHARALRMSRRELRHERREDGGLPEHRALRRRLHAELLAQQGLDGACLLLVDSATTRALALSFDAAADSAPRVALKAQGELARHMRARAEQRGLAVCVAPGLIAALFSLELTELVPRAQHAELAALMRELIAGGALPALDPP